MDSPEVVGRRQRRRVETRERIFDAAMELIAARGFEAVTVEDITERADVGKGTFFNYFAGKEAVVAFYFETQLDLATEALEALWATPAVGPVWPDMLQTLRLVAARAGRSKPFARTLLALSLTDARVREANRRLEQAARALSEELVRRGQRSGELRRDLPAEDLAAYVVACYVGMLYDWAGCEDDAALESVLIGRFELVREGLRA